MADEPVPSIIKRVAVSIAVACAAGLIAWVKITQIGYPADFAYFWTGANALIDHQSPYVAVQPGGPYHIESGFLYPLPAALVITPLALLPINPAGILFAALGIGALAFALSAEGFRRLPVLMSFPALWAVTTGQWSPFVTAAALTPVCAWVLAVKPTLGAAAWLYRPRLVPLLVAGGVTLASLLLMPDWPLQWLAVVRQHSGDYNVPLLEWRAGGPLLALAALRWRRPDGRILLGMACVPQTMLLYDQLPLALLAQTRMQATVFGLWSYGAIAAMRLAYPYLDPGVDWGSRSASFGALARVIVLAYYLPALAVVLRRPNTDQPA